MIMGFFEIAAILFTAVGLGLLIYSVNNEYSARIIVTNSFAAFVGYVLSLLASFSEKDLIDGDFAVGVSIIIYVFYLAYAYLQMLSEKKSQINRQSIIEAFDAMDIGLCYYCTNGRVILCNDYMNRISNRLFDTSVLNGNEFHDCIYKMSEIDGGEGKAEIKLGDNSFYFTSRVIDAYMGELIELKCVDVSKLHKKAEELKIDNERMKEVNLRIQEYGALSDELIREQEILNAKIRIHDNFSSLLLSTKRFLESEVISLNATSGKIEAMSLNATSGKIVANEKQRDGMQSAAVPGEEKIKPITRRWKETLVQIMAKDQDDYDRYYDELMKTAESVGVEIHIEGELCKAGRAGEVTLLAIQECLTNTVRHADGHNLNIKIEGNRAIKEKRENIEDRENKEIENIRRENKENREFKEKYRMILTNDGEAPGENAEEGGGLSMLRTKVEKFGGTMKIDWSPEFKLTIEINKGDYANEEV